MANYDKLVDAMKQAIKAELTREFQVARVVMTGHELDRIAYVCADAAMQSQSEVC